jgi:hypothetical protein
MADHSLTVNANGHILSNHVVYFGFSVLDCKTEAVAPGPWSETGETSITDLCARRIHRSAQASLTNMALPKTMMVATMPMAPSGCASPLRIKSASRARSSSLSLTTYFLTAISLRATNHLHRSIATAQIQRTPSNAMTRASKYPPAKPGALGLGPLEAAEGVADAAPRIWSRPRAACQRQRFICSSL